MLIEDQVMDAQEKIGFRLRSLYSGYGYSRYKMSKFEEYDLYSRNKDFLFSDSVITFTDTNGRLMALKPRTERIRPGRFGSCIITKTSIGSPVLPMGSGNRHRWGWNAPAPWTEALFQKC